MCTACLAALPGRDLPRCRLCARRLPSGAICGACLAKPPLQAAAVAALDYAEPTDQLIGQFKFERRVGLAPLLADLLAQALDGQSRADLIIPVPLSPARLRERGYNQAWELARRLPAHLGTADWQSVSRVIDTPPQRTLPAPERRSNLRSAFLVHRRLDGLRIAVVDDVMTTGSTVHEMARVLRRAGAREVVLWVVCRAP